MSPAFASVLAFEHRASRSYDDTDPSHLYLPNGSQLASFDRQFLGVCAPLVYEMWREAS